MVMNFEESEIQREQEQSFEKPVDKLYKDYAEITWFKDKYIFQLHPLQIPAYPMNTKEHQAKMKIASPLIPYQKNLNQTKS